MVKKSKLLLALDAQKGRDYEAEKKKKQTKSAEKRKRQKVEVSKGDESDDADGSAQQGIQKPKTILKSKRVQNGIPHASTSLSSGADSADEEDGAEQNSISKSNGTIIPQPAEAIDASASEAEQDSDVPLSDLEDEDMEDVVPHQRLTINNIPALTASRKRITVAKPKMPFHYHNSLVSTLPPSESAIPDPDDDLTRELEFYRIAREGVVTARSLLKKEKVPFTRPADYFAEMVKTDEHMGKVKKKLYDEAAGKKASEEARKLRDAKKFGKAVQVAKEQERAKEKRATLDNIKTLKRKRKGQQSTTTTEPDDLFQEISVESNPGSGSKHRDRFSNDGSNAKRQRRDSKFGFGGKKRFSKSGDAMSSADLSGFSNKSMKGRAVGGKKRPTTRRLGKSKRAARS